MNTFKRSKRVLTDRKNALVFAFWMFVNKIVLSLRFRDFQIIGRQNLPKSGPFLLVSNHITRWDGLIVYELIGRPSNFMVSPNELLGLQGIVLSSMGSFPADPKADLISHSMNQFRKGEGIVVFPEGNIFRDSTTHSFKTGAAKIAFAAAREGIDLPIIPIAINYAADNKVAQIVLGQSLSPQEYLMKEDTDAGSVKSLRTLSDRMHDDVSSLRTALTALGEKMARFIGASRRGWLDTARLTTDQLIVAEVGRSNACETQAQLRPDTAAWGLCAPFSRRKVS